MVMMMVIIMLIMVMMVIIDIMMMVMMVILMAPTPLLLPSQSEVESAGAEGGSAEQPPSHTTWCKIDIYYYSLAFSFYSCLFQLLWPICKRRQKADLQRCIRLNLA